METVTILARGTSEGNPGPATISVQILSSEGDVLQECTESIGNATDNLASYQAVMRGLQVLRDDVELQTKEVMIEVKLDNEHVKKQLSGELEITEPGLVPYFIEIHNMRVVSFPQLGFTHAA